DDRGRGSRRAAPGPAAHAEGRARREPLRHRVDGDAAGEGRRRHQGDRGRAARSRARRIAQQGDVPGPQLSHGAQHLHLPQPQAPDLNTIPPYKKEFDVVGGLRIGGSELKGIVDKLVEGFQKVQPAAKVSTNYMTSSEGALGLLFSGVSDVAPMGDDAKIPDQMPFFNAKGYVPTEVSIATGGYNMRGILFAWAVFVNKDNPLTQLSMEQLDGIFGSERSGGWEIGANA